MANDCSDSSTTLMAAAGTAQTRAATSTSLRSESMGDRSRRRAYRRTMLALTDSLSNEADTVFLVSRTSLVVAECATSIDSVADAAPTHPSGALRSAFTRRAWSLMEPSVPELSGDGRVVGAELCRRAERGLALQAAVPIAAATQSGRRPRCDLNQIRSWSTRLTIAMGTRNNSAVTAAIWSNPRPERPMNDRKESSCNQSWRAS